MRHSSFTAVYDACVLYPAAVVAAAQRQRAQLKHPPLEVARYIDMLQAQGLVQTAKLLFTYQAIL